MKKLFVSLFILLTLTLFAQKPCEIDTNVTDSLGTYKTTKQYIIYERSFAGNSTDISFSLVNTNGILSLDVQFLQKSADFIKANCLDANSKIYLQLSNGKIVTLRSVGYENCGTLVKDQNSINNRIMSGNFVFVKENYEDLKTNTVTFMRVKYATETIDYPFKTEFVSEIDKNKYEPENYFINYLKCIE
jgi:hypothetical protein